MKANQLSLPRRPSATRLLGIVLLLVAVGLSVKSLSLRDASTGQVGARSVWTGLSAAGTRAGVTLTLDPSRPELRFGPRAVGLSVEADELPTEDLSADHKTLVALMRLLGPGVLRLGGNSLDYSWWTGDGEHAPSWATSVVTPANLSSLNRLLAATGWRVILGVDLGHFDPSRAASEAHAAERLLGSHLLGFEIGNEPNHYGSPSKRLRPSTYSVANYLQELSEYSKKMATEVAKLSLFGPDLYSQPWLATIAADKGLPFVQLTQHYYPISYSYAKGACRGTAVPTAEELLSPQIRERESAALGFLVRLGQLAGRTTRLSETNNTGSCDASGGPATSPVFASALWSLDWALRSAKAGVAGLNFHGYFGRCRPSAYSPICASSYSAEARGEVIGRPEYYGLLAARQLEGGRFIPVQVAGQAGEGGFTAYATMHSGGEITLAVDNFQAKVGMSVVLRAPGYVKATSERLSASSLSATSGVSFGHASFDGAKAERPKGSVVRKIGGGAFRLEVSPASAAIVALRG
jgi:hypothetical protein